MELFLGIADYEKFDEVRDWRPVKSNFSLDFLVEYFRKILN